MLRIKIYWWFIICTSRLGSLRSSRWGAKTILWSSVLRYERVICRLIISRSWHDPLSLIHRLCTMSLIKTSSFSRKHSFSVQFILTRPWYTCYVLRRYIWRSLQTKRETEICFLLNCRCILPWSRNDSLQFGFLHIKSRTEGNSWAFYYLLMINMEYFNTMVGTL